MTGNKEYFLTSKSEYTKELEVVRRLNHKLSLLRLLFFVLIVISLISVFALGTGIVGYVLAAAFLAVFVFLCIKHGKSQRREAHLENLLTVCNRYIARFEGDYDSLPDKGEEFYVPGHDYAGDLDVFGKVSLFALYNVSVTAWGRREFARLLLGKRNDITNEEILDRQKAAADLINRQNMLMEYEATAIEGKSGKMPLALITLSESGTTFSKTHGVVLKLLPVFWLIPVILFVMGNAYAAASVLLVAVINLIAWFVCASQYAPSLKAVDGITRQVNSIASLFNILEDENVEADLLKSHVKGGAEGDRAASEGLRSLVSACAVARMREQPILALLLNAVYPYDLLCAKKLNTWAINYGTEFRRSLDCLADIESLMSCACVGIVSAKSTWPKLRECGEDINRNAYFAGEEITHPLINPTKVVSNSIILDGTTGLITGSNMSGKTTLIRTVGICSLLAYIGAPVPAVSAELGRMRIMSSMRIVDSIEEQMSTFKAELVRIAGIVKGADDGKPMLYLIDEIFRGTNSKDRTDGAMTVLRKLAKPYIIGLMTTHDYALCDMSVEMLDNIVYYHFSEKYDDQGITFDYKLQDGISHESNAAFLMKLVGIR